MKAQERNPLLQSLMRRFEKHMNRHNGHTWDRVLARLEESPAALRSLLEMESSGGGPDVIGYDETAGQYMFCDCSAETPTGRRSLCYDLEALSARKEHKPEGSAIEAAAAMGIELLDEAQCYYAVRGFRGLLRV